MNNESRDLEELGELLTEFSAAFGESQRPPTVLEITEYPHYENVCSRILAFYFDPGREHRLGNLFVECLLRETFPDFVPEALEVDEVRTEDPTNSGNRLDIVIESSGAVVGIENKVYAPIYNDLADYGNHLRELAKRGDRDRGISDDRAVYPIVLALNEVSRTDLEGFVPVTYKSFLNSVLESLGPCFLAARGRYLEFLLEFIETMLEMARRPTVDKEKWQFFEEREEQIIRLHGEIGGFRRELRSKVQKLAEFVSFPDDMTEGRIRNYVWREKSSGLFDQYVVDIWLDDDLQVTLATIIEPSGWFTSIWPRKGDSSRLDKHLDALELAREPRPGNPSRYVLSDSRFPADTPIEDVAAYLQPIIDALIVRMEA